MGDLYTTIQPYTEALSVGKDADGNPIQSVNHVHQYHSFIFYSFLSLQVLEALLRQNFKNN